VYFLSCPEKTFKNLDFGPEYWTYHHPLLDMKEKSLKNCRFRKIRGRKGFCLKAG
jgi:hypothetical protein